MSTIQIRVTPISERGAEGITRKCDLEPHEKSEIVAVLRERERQATDAFKTRAFRKLADVLENR